MGESVLSGIVLTWNEEKHIRECLASMRGFVDELVVFDSGSTDGTVEYAQAAGARVVARQFDNYAAQRNAAMEAATGDWIFFMDADERANVLVGQEIRDAISHSRDTIPETVLLWNSAQELYLWQMDSAYRVVAGLPTARFEKGTCNL